MAYSSKLCAATLVASQILLCAHSAAQSEAQCGGVFDVALTDAIGIAWIGGSAPRVHFVESVDDDRKDCPAAGPKCKATAYLVPGDVVLTLPQRLRGFVCASYANKKGVETYGWLPAAALTKAEAKSIEESGWTGTWRRTEAEIKIKRGKQGLHIEGEATYGAHDPRRVASGAVNSGEFEGAARRAGDVVLVADKDIASFETAPKDRCVVRMRRIGPYLLVEDNRSCGGMNVSFSGLYVRR